MKSKEIEDIKIGNDEEYELASSHYDSLTPQAMGLVDKILKLSYPMQVLSEEIDTNTLLGICHAMDLVEEGLKLGWFCFTHGTQDKTYRRTMVSPELLFEEDPDGISFDAQKLSNLLDLQLDAEVTEDLDKRTLDNHNGVLMPIDWMNKDAVNRFRQYAGSLGYRD